MATLQSLIDNFGRVKIFNFAEIIPALAGLSFFLYQCFATGVSLLGVSLLGLGCFFSGYFMFLRLMSFIVAITTMINAFMPLLRMLKENER